MSHGLESVIHRYKNWPTASPKSKVTGMTESGDADADESCTRASKSSQSIASSSSSTGQPSTSTSTSTETSSKKKPSPKHYRAPLPPRRVVNALNANNNLPTVSITEPSKEAPTENIELEIFSKGKRSLTCDSFSSINSSSSSVSSNNKFSHSSKIDEGDESDVEPSSESKCSLNGEKKFKKKRRFRSFMLTKKKVKFEGKFVNCSGVFDFCFWNVLLETH